MVSVKQHLLLTILLFTAGITQAETVTLELLNGDSLTGTIVEELSNGQDKVLDHPQLGRLTISASSLKPKSEPSAWKTSISAGLIGNERMDNPHYQQVLALRVSTRKTRIFFYLKLDSTPIKAKTRVSH